MSSKTAKYYLRRYNWQEINNLFCYDVVFPERLSQKQQLLRLYKNSLRRVYDMEVNGPRSNDIHGYARGCKEVRDDFEKLKKATNEKEVTDMMDKYEYFIETTYETVPVIRDNVAYEWRHGKGLWAFNDEDIEFDPWGYYDSKKLDYYPKTREFEFRDEFPLEEYVDYDSYNSTGWENIDANDTGLKSHEAESIDNFKNKVNELKQKYSKDVELWENKH
jgi:hypothetical protein